MSNDELKQFMSYKKKGKLITPISVLKINDTFIVAIYKGEKSDADILIRYRQKLKSERWSRIRTPKHIHWTVDILMKMSRCEELTKNFLEELMKIWKNEIRPLTEKEVNQLDLNELINYDKETLEKYKELSKYGEYNIKFLLLLAKLLMLQEKTNYPTGKLFQILLQKLKEGEDLFSILQTASLQRLK